MSIAGAIGFTAAVMGLIVSSAIAEETKSAPAVSLDRLWLEIETVKLQLNLLQADYLGRILAAMGAEAGQLRERIQKLDQAEKRLLEQMAAVERAAAAAQSEAERREQDEYSANRELRPGSDLAVLRDERDILMRRESDLAQKIQFERGRWQAALDAANSSQARLARIQNPAPGR